MIPSPLASQLAIHYTPDNPCNPHLSIGRFFISIQTNQNASVNTR